MVERICPKCNIPMNTDRCINPDCQAKTVMSTKIFWCEECNVPIFDEVCPKCGKTGHYIATDMRPVFPEENMLISLLLSKEPFKYQKDSVWYGSNAYIVNGKKVKLSVSKINKLPIEELKLIKEKYDKNAEKISYE